VSFAAVGNGEDDVTLCHDAQIAVHALHGMEEDGLGPRAGEGGDDLLSDEPGFADPRDDDPAAGAVDRFHRPGKIVVQFFDESGNALRFDLQNVPGKPDREFIFHVAAMFVFDLSGIESSFVFPPESTFMMTTCRRRETHPRSGEGRYQKILPLTRTFFHRRRAFR